MSDHLRAVLDCAGNQRCLLPSGLTVLVRPMPGYAAAHAIVAARFGSIDVHFRLGDQELTLPAGVAHYLEHKMFEDQEGDAFAKFARTGANANAFTSFDRTCYYFTATSQVEESLDVLLEMVTHPYFTPETVAKEQGIIAQEIKMYEDSPDWRLITELCQCLYHSHPIRSDIAGTCESIARITPGMLYDCCRAFYAPSNLVLCCLCGGMSGLYRRLYDQGLVNPGFGGEVLRVDGCCCILFTGESDQPDTVRQLLLEEIERIRSQGVDREIFTLCKNEKYGQLVENLENVEDAASQMADFALLGQTVAQQIEMLAGLTAEDADQAMQGILRPERMAYVKILPGEAGAGTEEE